jgi:hypothetical protein
MVALRLSTQGWPASATPQQIRDGERRLAGYNRHLIVIRGLDPRIGWLKRQSRF